MPEKGFHDLIEAYKKIDNEERLVLIGDADHESIYEENLKKDAINAGVILTGFKTGEELKVLFGNAKLFVMPSYHEGLPIALLEAMAYEVDVLVSNIPANLLVGLSNDDYFKVGDIDELKGKIQKKLSCSEVKSYKDILKEKYNWDIIAKQTIQLYEELV